MPVVSRYSMADVKHQRWTKCFLPQKQNFTLKMSLHTNVMISSTFLVISREQCSPRTLSTPAMHKLRPDPCVIIKAHHHIAKYESQDNVPTEKWQNMSPNKHVLTSWTCILNYGCKACFLPKLQTKDEIFLKNSSPKAKTFWFNDTVHPLLTVSSKILHWNAFIFYYLWRVCTVHTSGMGLPTFW